MTRPSLGIMVVFAAGLAASGCSSPISETDTGLRPDTGTRTDSAVDAPSMDLVVPPDDPGPTDTPPPTDTPIAMDVAPSDVPAPPPDAPASDAPASDAPASDGGTGCPAACPTGFSCGRGGYCVSPTGVPAFGHVYVIVMENHGLASIRGSSSAGYINMLLDMNASASAYSAIQHPSLPNYIALASGSTNGVDCDCAPTGTTSCNILVCNRVLGSCSCPVSATHLGDQFDAASIPWRTYGEGMGMPCNTADNGATHYAVRHLPFMYFNNVRTNMARCTERVRDYRDFTMTDLAAGTYRFTMISPNLCDDMHDTCGGDAIANGNAWLMANVPPILARPGFGPGGTDVLFIVWDEDDSALASTPLPFIAISPLARARAVSPTVYNHYSLVATVEDGFGMPRIAMASSVRPIADIWR